MRFEQIPKDYSLLDSIYGSREYHGAFTTKYCRPFLNGMAGASMRGFVERMFMDEPDAELLDLIVTDSYVHILFRCRGKLEASAFLKKLKRESHRHLRERFPGLASRCSSVWNKNIFLSTAGEAKLEDILAFTASQKGV